MTYRATSAPMVHVLPVPALASSSVVPRAVVGDLEVGEPAGIAAGHSGPTRSAPVTKGPQIVQACAAIPSASRTVSGADGP